MLNRNSPVYGARRRANTGIYFGEEKGIKTEVGEVHEASKKTETMSINKSTPKALFLPIGDEKKDLTV